MLPPDPARASEDRSRMLHNAFTLCPQARSVVDETIRRHCEVRSWNLLALNVRSNHVHVVVSCPAIRPERAMGEFKAWSTRALRAHGFVQKDRRVWTEHGSTRWVNHERGLTAAIEYVLNWQD